MLYFIKKKTSYVNGAFNFWFVLPVFGNTFIANKKVGYLKIQGENGAKEIGKKEKEKNGWGIR